MFLMRARLGREGYRDLAFEDEKGGGARKAEADTKAGKKNGEKPEVGQALRSAYQQTVNEDIPPEMLDLLGKLG